MLFMLSVAPLNLSLSHIHTHQGTPNMDLLLDDFLVILIFLFCENTLYKPYKVGPWVGHRPGSKTTFLTTKLSVLMSKHSQLFAP